MARADDLRVTSQRESSANGQDRCSADLFRERVADGAKVTRWATASLRALAQCIGDLLRGIPLLLHAPKLLGPADFSSPLTPVINGAEIGSKVNARVERPAGAFAWVIDGPRKPRGSGQDRAALAAW